MITIQRVDNGWILTEYEGDEENYTVFEVKGGYSELDTFVDLLWDINEKVGPVTNMDDPLRLSIKIEPPKKFGE